MAAVCAHNEAGVLAGAVTSLMSQNKPAREYEVVVVDNASTDDTGRVLSELDRRYGRRLRIVREERLGLGHARNRALAEARGPLVSLIDADAVAEPGWLEAIVDAFARSPRVGVVGGPIRIRWDHPRPRWWDERLAEALNEYRQGDEPHQLHYPRYPYGTNLAVRVDAAHAVGGFATTLDRQGRRLLAGGDGELCLRLEKAGWETWYEPAAVVHHRTAADRLRRRYIFRRAFHHGRSQYLIEKRHDFESGRYLCLTRILGRTAANLLRRRCDLPYLKFILFRAGYHYQRTLSRLRQAEGNQPGVDRAPEAIFPEPGMSRRCDQV